MIKKLFLSILVIICINTLITAQKRNGSGELAGLVSSGEREISFASVVVKGTTYGTVTNEEGRYLLADLPEGEVTVAVKALGYQSAESKIRVQAGESYEAHFNLEEDILNLDEVVVSADRSEQKRTEATVIVNTLSPELFNTSQSVTLGDGLNFSPGLRMENNCQNCGFTQVRMNGMEGPYSQILINSRPIFSGLAGVYGLELIPANMIEKVEVMRGGGSALYGSNAIAGTINIILKDPEVNAFEVGSSYALTGIGSGAFSEAAPDYTLHLNSSFVSDNRKSGITLFGFTRNREMFDANQDGFSEIAPMKNLTLGSRFFHRTGYRSKVYFDFFTINEQRDGGNMQDFPLHERDVAEAVKHDLKTAALTFEKYFRDYDLFSVYASGQFLNRDSYYGANQSLSDYGNSRDRTYHAGLQYKAVFGQYSLTTGIENTGSFLIDKKLGYPDYDNAEIVNDSIVSVPHTGNTIVADQSLVTSGIFAQYEVRLNKAKIGVGARFDHYEVKDLVKEGSAPKTGEVFSPRLSAMYEVFSELKARISYSQGYRAPQIFDEDLHIETSGSRQVINENDPDLRQETSHNITASLDYNGLIGSVYTGLLVEGFFTRLEDPFVNEIGEPDENGTVVYTRKNAVDGAVVRGINTEFKLRPLKDFSLTSGFTVQSSTYDGEQEFGEKRFFRTPDHYGYFAADWDFIKDFCLTVTGHYTGPMLIPYFGTDTDPEIGELRKSEKFFDLGVKLEYTMQLNELNIKWFGSIKNIFNAYQSDFDRGTDRDPAYMYGPMLPRTVYVGVRLASL